MFKSIRIAAAAAAILLTTGCGPMLYKATGGLIGDPGEVVVNEFGWGQEDTLYKKLVDVHKGGHFKADKKAVIPRVRVAVTQTASAYARADGGLGTTALQTAEVNMMIKLAKIEDSIYQQIAKAAYDDLVVRLKGLGYEILPNDVLTKSKAYQWAINEKEPNPSIIKGMMQPEIAYATPPGMPVYFEPGEKSAVGGFVSALTGQNSAMMNMRLVEELDAASITLTIYIHTIKFYTRGGTFASSAEIQVKPVLQIQSASLQYLSAKNRTSMFGNMGSLSLKKPMETAKPFGTIQDDFSFDIDFLQGFGVGDKKRSIKALVVEKDQFAAVSTDLVKSLNRMFELAIKDEL